MERSAWRESPVALETFRAFFAFGRNLPLTYRHTVETGSFVFPANSVTVIPFDSMYFFSEVSMENDLTLVQEENQEDFPFVEPIKKAMEILGWKAADLSRVSGVNESVISRILKGGRQASAANFYQVLCALGMICDVKPMPYKQ